VKLQTDCILVKDDDDDDDDDRNNNNICIVPRSRDWQVKKHKI